MHVPGSKPGAGKDSAPETEGTTRVLATLGAILLDSEQLHAATAVADGTSGFSASMTVEAS